MRFLSLFSGIEAASEAWAPLGWECAGVAEIDPFACAVLAHHHPSIPNLGDITKVTEMQIAALGHIDLVVFGSPCQDLSVAGKQKGLSGARSGLFFPAIDIVSWCRLWCGTRFALWENVPGAFSSNKGRDFAAVVDALAGLDGTGVPPKGWGTEGCAVGTEAMVEWSTLDAQWFGVAQRRRRVFALADFGDWAGRQPILLEPKGMRGDTAPSREAGQSTAVGTLRSTDGGCDVDHARAGHLRAVAFGGNNTAGPIDVATARNACSSSSGRLDFESETFLVQCATGSVSRALTAEGFDASEDGTGRGTPLIPVGVTIHGTHPSVQKIATYDEMAQCLRARTPGNIDNSSTTVVLQPLAFDTTQITSPANRSSPKPGDPCHPLAAGAHPPAIAFDCKSSGQNGFGVGTVVSTLRSMGHLGSHQNGGGHAAVAYSTKIHNTGSNNAGKIFEERTACLDANSPPPVLCTAWQVRRLTPTECERLQGFRDGHTAIPYRKKSDAQCPDGPRYKALGNSMAVPVMRWIGQRVDLAVLFQT